MTEVEIMDRNDLPERDVEIVFYLNFPLKCFWMLLWNAYTRNDV